MSPPRAVFPEEKGGGSVYRRWQRSTRHEGALRQGRISGGSEPHHRTGVQPRAQPAAATPLSGAVAGMADGDRPCFTLTLWISRALGGAHTGHGETLALTVR